MDLKTLPIKIFSREAIEVASQKTDMTIAIISITDIDKPLANIQANTNIRTCLRVQFDDVYEDECGAMTAEQANLIAAEVRNALDNLDVEQIWVHCEGGVSRSAAVAAAIGLAEYGTDEEIFLNPAFYPNHHVYITMLAALDPSIHITMAEWSRKHQLNVKAWLAQEDNLI